MHMVVSLNYCSQIGGNLYRAPYYNGNPNIGPRIIGNLDQYAYGASPWVFFLAVEFWLASRGHRLGQIVD